jgi:hypothetical protein
MSKKSFALLALLGIASAAGTAYAVRRLSESGDWSGARAAIPPQSAERFASEWDPVDDPQSSEDLEATDQTSVNAR